MAQGRKAQPKFHLSLQIYAILYKYEAISGLFGQRPRAELVVSKVDANVISVRVCVCESICEYMSHSFSDSNLRGNLFGAW